MTGRKNGGHAKFIRTISCRVGDLKKGLKRKLRNKPVGAFNKVNSPTDLDVPDFTVSFIKSVIVEISIELNIVIDSITNEIIEKEITFIIGLIGLKAGFKLEDSFSKGAGFNRDARTAGGYIFTYFSE